MKKILFSTLVLATLISSTNVHAASSQSKDIQIEVEAETRITLTKANGAPLNEINLMPEHGGMGYKNEKKKYSHTENITIKAIGAGKVRVYLSEEFSLTNKNGVKFHQPKIMLDYDRIHIPTSAYPSSEYTLNNGENTLELVINAFKPRNAVVGDIYSGIANLVVEEVI
ncbi:CS1 type fimbrial major subunit [Yersinia hibernica]|uniref:Alpha-related fimbriae minor subunit 1 n=1 Tax=Yersinia enterocolitica LC20 TaxID=1443113 RepID=A0A7U4GIP7_YEREN|nr:CS1 type fimbrial major subunit [Yersinia hibernica]AHM76248.1 hypothetical protein LC20_04997 [Yersinia hibernica]OVZ94665.1 hypothetical protein CBW54_01095 [Yersinia kristensenii]